VKRILLLLLASAPAFAQPPSDVPPVETTPVESAPIEAAPVEAAPVEAAPVETPTTEAPAVEAPADDDDIDLGALGLDPNVELFDDKLQIYGFADLMYTMSRWKSSLITSDDRFMIGNVNLFVRKNLSPRWRSLMEVRLLFAPNGSLNLDGSNSYATTGVADNANFERLVSWGGISIQRVYVEYDIAPWLTLRAGHFLTPYGIWNIDHGSPTIIGTSRPYIIGEQLFPEHQTGLEAFGAKSFDEYRLEYHATLSNGRSPFDATRDPDRSPAVGGRVALTTPWLGEMKLGASAYHGRAFEGTSVATGIGYTETAIGLDASWDRDGLHVQGELLYQQRRYLDGQRAARGTGFMPDGVARGFYALAGYRFTSAWNAMPYVMYEDYAPFDTSMLGSELRVPSVGVNFRPIPSVVLKAQATYIRFPSDGLLSGEGKAGYLQAAWVF
jgi:hypothetical protein